MTVRFSLIAFPAPAKEPSGSFFGKKNNLLFIPSHFAGPLLPRGSRRAGRKEMKIRQYQEAKTFGARRFNFHIWETEHV